MGSKRLRNLEKKEMKKNKDDIRNITTRYIITNHGYMTEIDSALKLADILFELEYRVSIYVPNLQNNVNYIGDIVLESRDHLRDVIISHHPQNNVLEYSYINTLDYAWKHLDKPSHNILVGVKDGHHKKDNIYKNLSESVFLSKINYIYPILDSNTILEYFNDDGLVINDIDSMECFELLHSLYYLR